MSCALAKVETPVNLPVIRNGCQEAAVTQATKLQRAATTETSAPLSKLLLARTAAAEAGAIAQLNHDLSLHQRESPWVSVLGILLLLLIDGLKFERPLSAAQLIRCTKTRSHVRRILTEAFHTCKRRAGCLSTCAKSLV